MPKFSVCPCVWAVFESTTTRTAGGLDFPARGGKRQRREVPQSLRVNRMRANDHTALWAGWFGFSSVGRKNKRTLVRNHYVCDWVPSTWSQTTTRFGKPNHGGVFDSVVWVNFWRLDLSLRLPQSIRYSYENQGAWNFSWQALFHYHRFCRSLRKSDLRLFFIYWQILNHIYPNAL